MEEANALRLKAEIAKYITVAKRMEKIGDWDMAVRILEEANALDSLNPALSSEKSITLYKLQRMGDAAILIYDDLAEFFAGLAPEKVLAFKPSVKLQERLSELLAQKQGAPLSADENEELEHLFNLERIIRLAKAHAAQILGHGKVYS